MKNLIKHLVSLILPVTVLIIVPFLIEKHIFVRSRFSLYLGLIPVLAGLTIMIITIFSFATVGKGTLAPWNPTRKLVIFGLYRYVRNPMILGVLIVLTGESLILLSLNILIWAIVFFIINTLDFMFSEEPGLEKRFGEEYLEYRKNVRRWIPRLKPYNPD